jgi:hypothetical protein
MNENGAPEYDCGLDGPDDVPVNVGRFNRFMRRVRATHIEEQKREAAELRARQDEMDKIVSEHLLDDKVMHAKIIGGLMVIKWMIPLFSIVVPALLIFVLHLMHKAGLL